MNEVTVTPQIGCYLVRTEENGTEHSEQVSKEKRCTCGGTSCHPCAHIEAVASYLRQGGRQAAPLPQEPTCPLCGTTVERRGPGFWRCPQDPSHYWQWRGEGNGGAIRMFLTRPHPNKQGAFYEMTVEERQAFLAQASRRLHARGYTPYAQRRTNYEPQPATDHP